MFGSPNSAAVGQLEHEHWSRRPPAPRRAAATSPRSARRRAPGARTSTRTWISGRAWPGSRLSGARGFSNDRSLTYWVWIVSARLVRLAGGAAGGVCGVSAMRARFLDKLAQASGMDGRSGPAAGSAEPHQGRVADLLAGQRPNEAPMGDHRDLGAVGQLVGLGAKRGRSARRGSPRSRPARPTRAPRGERNRAPARARVSWLRGRAEIAGEHAALAHQRLDR